MDVETWTIQKAEHQRIDGFELWCWRRLFRVPWIAKRSNQSILNQPWIIIGRIDAEAEAPILRPPDAMSWLIGKDLDAGKDWRRKEKGTAEDEMIRAHHWIDGHEFEQTPWDSEGQGSLACCSPWSHKGLTQFSEWTTTKNRQSGGGNDSNGFPSPSILKPFNLNT